MPHGMWATSAGPMVRFRIRESITEPARANKNLGRSEPHFCAVFEQSSPDGRTLWINRAWEELWGVTPDDIAGYNLPEDQQLVVEGIMPYIQGALSENLR
jgi:PAS domain-containing protein